MSFADISRNAPAKGFPGTSSFSCAAEGEMASGEKTEKSSVRGGRQSLCGMMEGPQTTCAMGTV